MKPKHTLKHWLIAGALLTLPWASHAAGLGNITVISALGQPLRAEIDLIAVPKDEVDLLVAKVASAEEYRRAGLERPEGSNAIRFSVEKRPNGQPYLKVTSLQPVNEPYLQLLVQLEWPAGRVLRNYTLLLDPPGLNERPAVAAVTAPTVVAPAARPEVAVAPSKAEPVPKRAPAAKPVEKAAQKAQPAPEAKQAAPKQEVLVRAQPSLTPAEQTFPRFDEGGQAASAPPPAVSATGQQKTYKVKPGDSLARIAQQFKPEGYSLEQMLVSLFEANRQAFEGNNMNRLKSGQILRVPDAADVAAVGRDQAVREVKAHAADWNAYRQKLAAAATSQPAEAAQEASGKITAKVEEKAPKAAEGPKDVLKLSKGEAAEAGKGAAAAGSRAGSGDSRALQDKLNAALEEAAAKDKALKEANSRIADLEKNIQDMKRLLETQNQQLAALQKEATAAAKPEAAKPQAAEPTQSATQAAAPPKVAEPPKPAEAPKPAQAAAPPKPQPVKKVPRVMEPVPEPSFLEELLGNPLYVAGGGAVAIGGLLVALWAVGRRRKKSLASFEDSIMTGGDLKANTVFGNTGGGQIDTGDTSFLTDFSQGGMGAIDTNDVDPIAEAEVYMAYGRDAQAEEILKEAISKDPNRQEVQLKLLEIYFARRNKEAFEAVATELYAATAGRGPLWEKAAEMGRSLDPDNPLYAASGASAPAAAAAAGVAAAAVAAAAAAQPAKEGAPSLDFALDLDTAGGAPLDQATVPSEVATQVPLEFNLDTAAPSLTEAAEEAASPAAERGTEKDEREQGLTFDLDTIIPKAVEKQEAQAPVQEEISLDLPQLGELATPASHAAEQTAAQEPGEAVGESVEGLDFHFEFETPTEAAKPAEAPTEALLPDLDLSGLELEMPGEMGREPAQGSAAAGVPLEEAVTLAGTPGEMQPAESWEEASTKLDLARAYMEMGDKEGAREILEEVIQEGGPEQQADAKKLLASLA
ncbi:FimV/HubP family polar landmark protein [Thiobacter aerophilum]|uniref:FimV/HubP family polar landmark protein n=1 Tax=Thiobacter aerophilum TaxID=3121275 RepID=A0ABV0EFX4_9BURK